MMGEIDHFSAQGEVLNIGLWWDSRNTVCEWLHARNHCSARDPGEFPFVVVVVRFTCQALEVLNEGLPSERFRSVTRLGQEGIAVCAQYLCG